MGPTISLHFSRLHQIWMTVRWHPSRQIFKGAGELFTRFSFCSNQKQTAHFPTDILTFYEYKTIYYVGQHYDLTTTAKQPPAFKEKKQMQVKSVAEDNSTHVYCTSLLQ